MARSVVRWVFTLNNYSEEEQARIRDFAGSDIVKYLIFGREVGDSGTPHLQGFAHFKEPKSLNWLRAHFSDRAHFEKARGSFKANRTYCSKDGDFEEFGTAPSQQGSRSDLDDAKRFIDEFVRERKRAPNDTELATAVGLSYIRYRRGLRDYATAICPTPVFRDGDLRQWQAALDTELRGPPSQRSIKFVIDREGNRGKTFFQQWYLSRHSDKVQILGTAKRDDMAHMVDESKSIFFVNVPRGQMEFFQYSVIESLKDQMVASPKYNSYMKMLAVVPHVMVFANEWPDESRLSVDRWDFMDLDSAEWIDM